MRNLKEFQRDSTVSSQYTKEVYHEINTSEMVKEGRDKLIKYNVKVVKKKILLNVDPYADMFEIIFSEYFNLNGYF